MLFGYIGPDTVLPLTSAVAAIVGFFLMTGRYSLRLVAGAFRRIGRLFAPRSAAPKAQIATPAGKRARPGGVAAPHTRRPTAPTDRADAR
jgi:hypothetical protein